MVRKRKERKNRSEKLNRGKENFCMLKINCKGKRTVGKQRNKCRKIIIHFKI